MSFSEFKCSDCDAVYGNMSSFRTHIRRKHGKSYSQYIAHESPESILKCEICGFEATNLVTHITRTHKMTVDEYKRSFNVGAVQKLTSAQHEKLKSKDSKKKQKSIVKAQRELEAVQFGIDPVECKLCGFKGYSLCKHITAKHKISTEKYREMFPDCGQLQRSTPESNRRNSQGQKKRYQDPEQRASLDKIRSRSWPSQIEYWTSKGFTEDEAAEKVRTHQSSASLSISEESKAAKALRQSGDANPSSLVSVAARHGVSLEHAHVFMPCYGRKGDLHPMYGKKHTEEAIRKIGSHINHSGRSILEHELTDTLVLLYDGSKNDHAAGWCCDYVNDDIKVVVELFGDFWHHNPSMYSSDWINPFTRRTSLEVWRRDIRKLTELSAAGYSVNVVWESDWRHNKVRELERIKNAFDRASSR